MAVAAVKSDSITVTFFRSQRKPLVKFTRSCLTFSGEMYSASASSVGLRSVLTWLRKHWLASDLVREFIVKQFLVLGGRINGCQPYCSQFEEMCKHCENCPEFSTRNYWKSLVRHWKMTCFKCRPSCCFTSFRESDFGDELRFLASSKT